MSFPKPEWGFQDSLMDYLIPKKISGVRAWQALSPKCGTRGAHQTAMAEHGGHETHEKNAQIYDIYGHLWLFKNGKTDFPKLFGIVIPFDFFPRIVNHRAEVIMHGFRVLGRPTSLRLGFSTSQTKMGDILDPPDRYL